MHHDFKSTIIENMTKHDVTGILPEPETLHNLLNVTSEVKMCWINAAHKEIAMTIEFK